MVQMRGVCGYLDGSIPMPSTPTFQPKDGSTVPETNSKRSTGTSSDAEKERLD